MAVAGYIVQSDIFLEIVKNILFSFFNSLEMMSLKLGRDDHMPLMVIDGIEKPVHYFHYKAIQFIFILIIITKLL